MTSSIDGPKGQPLFIVDRDWMKQGSKTRKSWTGNVRNRSLYGLAIQVTQHNVPNTKATRPRKTKPTRRRRHATEDASGSDHCSEHETVIPQVASSLPVDLKVSTTSLINLVPTTNGNEKPKHASNPSQAHPDTLLSASLPTHWPGFERIKGLECYLDYYLDIIGTSQHPLENKFGMQNNAIRSSWFPLAFEDDLWLQNIAMFSALHHASNQNHDPPADVSALMSSFLSQLNDRIKSSDLSDGTIASVSCLALGEHLKGNNHLSKVHATGLTEMVRLRGGLQTIQRSRRAKIVRADIVRSVDNLEPPMLPRMASNSLWVLPPASLAPPGFSTRVGILARTGAAPELISATWSLGSICKHLESAWAGANTLDATTYYEHILCLNHDLLSYQPSTNLDEVLRISMINFTQPMFRYCAFSERACQTRLTRLQKVFDGIRNCKNNDIAIWIAFTAYLFSQQTLEEPWFSSKLKEILDERGVARTGAWSDLRNILRSFLWTDSIHESGGRRAYELLEQDGVNLSCHDIDVGRDRASTPYSFVTKSALPAT